MKKIKKTNTQKKREKENQFQRAKNTKDNLFN